ncbi:hypothetical protein [Rubrimonas cliftonensis]|uniref:Uncharacterized protein n=1 Tax=Rubrimonas cliftonensis TaxID=89524 RepID=A0A1H4EIY0_9RHOB|nr:hypothetical protein [Rubrimonas cliftonensis]SEA84906.1 hypothetical protein SAMN05444370_11437 [Rubrimonas cliftonensis]
MQPTLTTAGLVAACCLVALAACAARAQSPLDGERIRAVVSGKTIAGGMLDGGPYSEFYGEDGVIRGEGYTGAWTVEGDAMCFDYGEGPDCWSVGLSGDEILWIRDAEVLGTGRAVEGNVNGY